MINFKTRSFLFVTAAAVPFLLVACTAEPDSYRYQSSNEDSAVTVYHQTTAVAPATTYYDASTGTTVHTGPTKVTTETVGPAYKTYEDDDGFWHTTYADVDTDDQ